MAGLITGDHGYWGAQLIEPYVDEEVSWAVRHHQALRDFPDESIGYSYPEAYIRYFGEEYQPPDYIRQAYEQVRRHKWYMTIAALEDKIVQGAAVMVLNAIYEEDFLGFSYGFRPGRGPHDAPRDKPVGRRLTDAVVVGITNRKVNPILDADIRDFFGSVSQKWLVRFPGSSPRTSHRIGDKRIIRLIQKWLRAGILEDGAVTVSDRGTGQGSVASPLLANIYLHYVFDLWAERWRRHEATGDMIIVRYADDLVAGFEHEDDARRFLDAMRVRLEEFALSLHPDKTRLIEFGRHAAANRETKGLGKPETFNFLGFSVLQAHTERSSSWTDQSCG